MENCLLHSTIPDLISIIFWYLIHNAEDFQTFSRLLIAYLAGQNRVVIKDVLERLNWHALYQYHNHEFEVTRDKFFGFMGFAVRNEAQQALFLDSVQNLFRMHDVQHHLSILQNISGNHLPSSFAFIFFKAIYMSFQREQTVTEMALLFSQKYLHGVLLEVIELLQAIYFEITDEVDHLLPVYKFCPHAFNKDPIYKLDGNPWDEELYYSLCDKTVQGKYREDDEFYGKALTIAQIFQTPCDYCRVQLILYKILLSRLLY